MLTIVLISSNQNMNSAVVLYRGWDPQIRVVCRILDDLILWFKNHDLNHFSWFDLIKIILKIWDFIWDFIQPNLEKMKSSHDFKITKIHWLKMTVNINDRELFC